MRHSVLYKLIKSLFSLSTNRCEDNDSFGSIKSTEVNSFIGGMGRSIDLGSINLRIKLKELDSQSDMENMRSDWERVGKHMRSSLDNFEKANVR